LLSWDQEVLMPIEANEHRAQIVSYLSSLIHDIFIDKKFGKLLESLSKTKNLSNKEKRNVEITLKDWKEAVLVPTDFIKRYSYAQSKAYDVWVKAKENNDFASFAPNLQEIINMQKECVTYVQWKGKPYDAMLDSFEESLSMEILDKVFENLKDKLIPIIKKVTEQTSSTFPLKGMFAASLQKQYSYELLNRISYDLKRGRLDESVHPFSTSLHPTDSRITTSFDEKDLMSIWSTLHEAGHGMYEQGLNGEEAHLPSGQAISLSVHESQSRFWENMIGKNLLFWKNEFSNLREYFKTEISEMTVESFFDSINKVEPSLIRIDADEITYHMHIIIRYEIEKAIFEDNYPVEDLPKLWNQKYKEYLGIDVPSDSVGILQDIHWSSGAFGYFPTYTLGSMFSAQLYDYMKKNADIEDKIIKKDYASIKKWLNENVHSLGGIYTFNEVCEKVTGEKLKATYFTDYLIEKYKL
jgi:carboxypeptidase Taq